MSTGPRVWPRLTTACPDGTIHFEGMQVGDIVTITHLRNVLCADCEGPDGELVLLHGTDTPLVARVTHMETNADWPRVSVPGYASYFVLDGQQADVERMS